MIAGPPTARSDDVEWLNAAARLSLRGRPSSRPNPAVGAILVKNGIVVGRGWTAHGGRPHAEAMALAQAASLARGATAYVTLEPCALWSARGPACADGLVAAGVARVVVGVIDPDPRTAGQGIARLRDAGIEAEIVDHQACRASLAGYLIRSTLGRPHVTLKLATSLDGRIAHAEGADRWITGEAARAHVHSHRALADAILVGGGTWRMDAPRLDVRLAGLENRSPERWVLSRSAIDGVRTIASPDAIQTLEGIQYLYVEGGAQAAAAFLEADFVDRIELYTAPIEIGGQGMDVLAKIGLRNLDEVHGRWRAVDRRQLGSDLFTAYERHGGR